MIGAVSVSQIQISQQLPSVLPALVNTESSKVLSKENKQMPIPSEAVNVLKESQAMQKFLSIKPARLN